MLLNRLVKSNRKQLTLELTNSFNKGIKKTVSTCIVRGDLKGIGLNFIFEPRKSLVTATVGKIP